MIKELKWDSAFFKRKIGQLQVSRETLHEVPRAVEKARVEKFRYLLCRLNAQDTYLIRELESTGFYLCDIGVTWQKRTAGLTPTGAGSRGFFAGAPPRRAAGEDVPMLRDVVRSLFRDSRFYHDPFFSEEEAERLYQTWIENSVKGEAAEIVFCVPGKGVVACGKSDHSGKIVLIGVKEDARGQGIGRALTEKAMEWFIDQGLDSACVRTQLRNLGAMNFYCRLGFTVTEYDITLGKVL